MRRIKSGIVANFNVVFGEHERPMLEYFESVIYPMFVSGIERRYRYDSYFFAKVHVSKMKNGIFALIGTIVKRTVLEIKSDLNEKGELVNKFELHSAAPYSTFLINLCNHRMLFVPNQKGSPTLSAFQATVRYSLEVYLNKHEEIKETPNVNIVGIPNSSSLQTVLKDVKHIRKLTLKFYPLNGDTVFNHAIDVLSTRVRREIGSDAGEISFTSPNNLEGVEKLLDDSQGTIRPVMRVETVRGTKATYEDEKLSEKYPIDLESARDIDDENYKLLDASENIETFNRTNDLHNGIYEQFKNILSHFV